MAQQIKDIWYARPPQAWAAEPAWMSVSTLVNIEACPRRWALSYANYPDIWEQNGYPPKPYLTTRTGQIIHGALETVTKALNRAGCSSIRDPLFISVLRELGGYTKIIEAKLDSFITKFSDNPRTHHNADFIATKLRAQIPELRSRLQILISKLRLQGGDRSTTQSKGAPSARKALPIGSHAEVQFRVEHLRWHGYVDCLNLGVAECEIVDFKTGAAKPEHEFQARVYSLLWARDAVHNPTARLADKVVLTYPDKEIAVNPLELSELDDFERDLMTRTHTALNLIRQDPPPAYPNAKNCSFCPVRQICDSYWSIAVQQRLKLERLEGATIQSQAIFADIEVELIECQSLTNWSAVITVSGELTPRSPVYVQFSEANISLLNLLKVGGRLRLIDAYISRQTEDEISSPPFIILNRMSEVFIL